MGGHQTYPGQDLDSEIPQSRSPDREYDQDFWSAGMTYMTFGVVNPPGGALTPWIRHQALKAGFGQRAALAIGLGGEYVSGIFLIGLAGWLFDPLDLYEGGLIPDEVAQLTTVPVSAAIGNIITTVKSAKPLGGQTPIDFQMEGFGSFQ